MRKMKNILFAFLVVTLLSSCSEYQKVLNKGLNADRYKMAVELYDKGDYNKALPLFEKLVGPYAGKPQMERIQYMTADSYYHEKDYTLSSYYFSKFIANYPQSSKVEEAAFLSAKSYYLGAPKYSLDQQDTYKALEEFQKYIDDYPSSELIEEANGYYKELTNRLEKKSFEVAKQYYHTENYYAAIIAFDSFNEEFLGSIYKEDALYYRFKANYDLGMKSILDKKEDRLLDAQAAYYKFQKSFPESKKMKELDDDLSQIEKELNKTREQLATISQK